MKAISLGAGIQSTALLLLSNEGVIDRADVAIFADTGWEPRAVYEHLEKLEKASAIPVIRVSAGNLRDDALGIARFSSIPLYVKDDQGKTGMLRRQCTREYKVAPINKKLREMGATRTNPAEVWIGISIDEAHRMKDPFTQFTVHRWPLIELRWNRQKCRDYLESKGWKVAKSSCIGCPFHDDHYWERLRSDSPKEFADAVDFDEKIRHLKRIEGDAFVHRRAIPLADAVLEKGEQKEMWNMECGGYCDT